MLPPARAASVPASASIDGDLRFARATADHPGGVALLHLWGVGLPDLLRKLTGQADWSESPGRARLVDLAGLDQGLAVLLDRDRAQLMPHGSPIIVDHLARWLTEHGAQETDPRDPGAALALYPEAKDELEAWAMQTMAHAASPAAVDRLAQQPALWRIATPDAIASSREHQTELSRLLRPPTVVVVGQPNTGKSTLTNAVLGQDVSLTADLPGTTRDWTTGFAELCPSTGEPGRDALAVRWLDTPGIRPTSDTVEARAIEMARQALREADVLVALRDPDHAFVEEELLPRQPDLWVMNKADRLAPDRAIDRGPIHVSALTGQGLPELTDAVLLAIGAQAIPSRTLWAFNAPLHERMFSA